MISHVVFVALGLVAAASAGDSKVHAMHNGGTPPGIPGKTDCRIRQFVWEAGKKLLPRRGEFKTLYDAMQLSACGVDGSVAPPLPSLSRASHRLALGYNMNP